MKIVQGIFYSNSYITPVIVDEEDLYDEVSERGEGGFGSTGV